MAFAEWRAAACSRPVLPSRNLGTDVAAGAWPVVDDEGLAEPLRQPLAYQARHDVGRTAGWNRDDHTHGPRWIGVGPCNPERRREGGGAGSQV